MKTKDQPDLINSSDTLLIRLLLFSLIFYGIHIGDLTGIFLSVIGTILIENFLQDINDK